MVAVSRRFERAGNRLAHHHAVGAARNRFTHVAAGAKAAIGDDRDVFAALREEIIARLRRKIGHAMIETVRGLGYRITASAETGD